ncbi:hypothetical protein BJX64DRAFT_268385 [Aspergillus heterothallicus]
MTEYLPITHRNFLCFRYPVLMTTMEIFTGEDYQMALATARFEREYDQVYIRTMHLLNAECDRVQCMEKLLLRIENETLQLYLDQTGQDLVLAREAETNARFQVDGAIKELARLQGVIQTSSREVDNLRRELASLNGLASDSQQYQAENLRLLREISSLQSELEALKSQNAAANVQLTEKQALTRQLNALELRLESEKQAHERALAKGSKQTDEVTALASLLEEARRELELERSHRSQMTSYPSGTNETEGTSKKLEGLKADLPYSNSDSRNSAKKIVRSERTTMVPLRGPTNRLHSELNIATPGAVRAQKQQRQISTMPGEKSSFSITPFLNRSTDLADSTMSSDDELNEVHIGSRDQQQSDHVRRHDSSPTVSKQHQAPAPKHSSKSGTGRSTATTVGKDHKSTQISSLMDSAKGVEGYSAPLSRTMGQRQTQLKKRKLGLQRDRILFDTDEEDNILHDSRKPGRKLAGAGQANHAGSRVFTGPAGFSPLKRDKKRG